MCYQFSQTEKSHLLSRNTTFPIYILQPDKPSQLFKQLPLLQRKDGNLEDPPLKTAQTHIKVDMDSALILLEQKVSKKGNHFSYANAVQCQN